MKLLISDDLRATVTRLWGSNAKPPRFEITRYCVLVFSNCLPATVRPYSATQVAGKIGLAVGTSEGPDELIDALATIEIPAL